MRENRDKIAKGELMEKEEKKFFNPDYKGLYKTYRKLPGILTIIWAVIFFIEGLVLAINQEDVGVALTIWIIGGGICALIWFLTSVYISATVVRTDAVLDIKKMMTGNTTAEDDCTEEQPSDICEPTTEIEVPDIDVKSMLDDQLSLNQKARGHLVRCGFFASKVFYLNDRLSYNIEVKYKKFVAVDHDQRKMAIVDYANKNLIKCGYNEIIGYDVLDTDDTIMMNISLIDGRKISYDLLMGKPVDKESDCYESIKNSVREFIDFLSTLKE